MHGLALEVRAHEASPGSERASPQLSPERVALGNIGGSRSEVVGLDDRCMTKKAKEEVDEDKRLRLQLVVRPPLGSDFGTLLYTCLDCNLWHFARCLGFRN